ncbi:MAG: ATP-binding protein [Sedimenticola sp.]|nr:ATP-binding protein [Sedimenticola sp.]
MSIQSTAQREQLEDAFQVFNQVSGQLVDSYHQLQQQVARLTAELSSARNDRLLELAEKELIANRLTRLLETLPAAVVVVDGDGVVQQFNPAAETLLDGIQVSDRWSSLQARLFRPDQQGDECWLRSGRLLSMIERSLDPESGKILLLIDITEKRQLQERIDRRLRLSQMGEVAAQLAHQIRTPLSSALLYTANLAQPDLSESQRSRFSHRCLERLRHIESQINDMLAFARGGRFELAPVAINDLLRELVQHLEPACQTFGANLEYRSGLSDAVRVSGNQAALLGAMTNIAMNALQQETADHLQITSEITDCRVLVHFRDNGPGISEQDQPRLFDPFYTTRADGTGLGLAVVQSVVLAHQGRVLLESRPGEGALFSIQLPQLMEAAERGDVAGNRRGPSRNRAVRSSA